MADLHERIAAKLDQIEALAMDAATISPMPWGYLKPAMALVDVSLDPFADMFSDAAALLIVHVASPDVVLRVVAGYRMLLSIAGVMAEQAKLKQQSADRFGDPKDNDDMDAMDRIAWLLQSDMAQTYAEHARQIEAAVAEALGIDPDQQ